MTDESTTTANDEAKRASEFLAGILERMKISADIASSEEEGKIVLTIECEHEDDVQRVIGRHGQVVDAFQHLVSKMMAKGREERGRPVIVDAGGYRQRHVERLEGLASRMAEKARKSGEAVDLSPMSAFDRRIVHMALAEVEGVSTRSEGEGDLRHVIVEPE